MNVINPWEYTSTVDYQRLFDDFGISRFDELLKRIKYPHRYMRRGIIFGHRSYDSIVEAVNSGKPFSAMSGFMPSGRVHLGHKMVMEEIIWHQQHGGTVFMAVADMEAHSVRGISWKECRRIGVEEYILSLIALGFKPEGGRIYFQSTSPQVKDLAFELGIKANFSELSAIYGFNGETNIAHMVSATLQSADILHPQLKEFGGPRPVVIPVGADQDPHIRLTRGLAESCDTGVMGKAYGIHRAMDGFGSILGAVMALILLFFLDIRDIFLVASIPAIIGVLLVLFIKEKKMDVPVKKVASIRISFKALTPELKNFIIISTIFTLGHFGYAFLLLRALNIGQNITTIFMMYILFYLIYTIFTIPAGVISDKFGRKPVIISGYLLFGLTSIGLSLTTDLFLTICLFMLYGLFFAMIDGVQRAFVVDLTPPELKATALGTFHAVTGLAAMPAGLIAGLLWEYFSPETTFFYSFIVSIIAAVLLLRSKSPCEFKSV